MASPAGKWVPVGVVGRRHGLSGEVRFRPHPGCGVYLSAGSKVRLREKNGKTQDMEIASVRGSEDAPIVLFTGISDPEEASRLTNSEVLVLSENLPKASGDEFYVHEVVGAKLLSKDGKELGHVEAVQDGGGRSYLVCSTPKGEAYLPATKAALLSVDSVKREVKVNPAALIYPGEVEES
ncbi:MAG: ribosome maturation factor RimM [Bdellovibrionota bacterium]